MSHSFRFFFLLFSRIRFSSILKTSIPVEFPSRYWTKTQASLDSLNCSGKKPFARSKNNHFEQITSTLIQILEITNLIVWTPFSFHSYNTCSVTANDYRSSASKCSSESTENRMSLITCSSVCCSVFIAVNNFCTTAIENMEQLSKRSGSNSSL